MKNLLPPDLGGLLPGSRARAGRPRRRLWAVRQERAVPASTRQVQRFHARLRPDDCRFVAGLASRPAGTMAPVFSPSVENLVAQLTRLPGIGSRTAQRLAFHILQRPKEEALALAAALDEVKERVRFCRECGNLTEEELCGDLPRRAPRPRADLRRRAAGRRRLARADARVPRALPRARRRALAARRRRARATCASTSCFAASRRTACRRSCSRRTRT